MRKRNLALDLRRTQVRAQRTAMDKVAVSRAVASLITAGRLLREFDDNDRRRSVLRLSDAGYAVYEEIAALALEFEKQVLAGMQGEERELLFRLLDRLDELELDAERVVLRDETAQD